MIQLLQTISDFSTYINNRLQLHFTQKPALLPAAELPHIDPSFFPGKHLNHYETIILLTALVTHIQPVLFNNAIEQYMPKGGEFPEFGGIKGSNTRYMLPTGDTVLFLLAGNDISKRKQVLGYFSPSHWFYTDNVLGLEYVKEGEPRMSGKIILQQDYVELFTTGIVSKPTFSPDFPAKLVTTKMDWTDLVMPQKTVQQITDIKTWLHHNTTFLKDWGMEKRIKPGYRALFYGPPGTGKTLAATLLGKQFEQDVYRIDLSQVVSKYIGETEKNLEKIFNKAANKNWILFFDEADALFGKRSNVQNAHDKYANQEVSYLLQRVEDFPGLIILASNFKSNIDQAFIRRFNAIIHFPMPGAAERLEIWKTAIPPKALLAGDVDLLAIASRYELSGSSIVSVIHYASLQTIYNNSNTILKKYIIEGIKREFEKEERVFTGE
jgi:hypothetical protein